MHDQKRLLVEISVRCTKRKFLSLYAFDLRELRVPQKGASPSETRRSPLANGAGTPKRDVDNHCCHRLYVIDSNKHRDGLRRRTGAHQRKWREADDAAGQNASGLLLQNALDLTDQNVALAQKRPFVVRGRARALNTADDRVYVELARA